MILCVFSSKECLGVITLVGGWEAGRKYSKNTWLKYLTNSTKEMEIPGK